MAKPLKIGYFEDVACITPGWASARSSRPADSFKKVVLVRTVIRPSRDEDGIVTMSVYDFLLDERSLELA